MEKLQAMIDDKVFQDFKKKYDSPNCFKIIGNDHFENRHTNFLAWLLNPKDNHGLRSEPLRFFLLLLGQNTKNLSIDEIQIKTQHSISTGSGNKGVVDLYAYNDKMILVIENKIDSEEHLNRSTDISQTDAYFQYFEKHDAEKTRIYVYLSPSKLNSPTNKSFIPITYQELYDNVIAKCLDSQNINESTKIVLTQYTDSLSLVPHLAYTHRKEAKVIYLKYQEIFDELPKIINTSKTAKGIFTVYHKYINEILGSVGKMPIRLKKLERNDRIVQLCEEGIIELNQTKLISGRPSLGLTYYICFKKTGEKYRCYVSYSEKNNASEEKIQTLMYENGEICEFDTIDSAAGEVERVAYRKLGRPIPSGVGIAAGEWKVLHSAKKEYEGKYLADIP